MASADLFLIIWYRRWIFAAVGLFVVAAAGLFLVLVPRTYLATTSVLIDVRQPESVAAQPSVAQLSPAYMATQVDIIKSQRVAMRAVELLELEKSPAARSVYEQETGGRISFAQFYAGRLIERLSVEPSRESNVVEISMRGPDPRFAAATVNALARAYIATQLELRVAPAREFAEWFSAQTASLRETYERAQHRLSDFQRRSGIVSFDERIDVEHARLQELSSQFTLLQAHTVESGKKSASASRPGADGANLPEVMNNPLLTSLKGEHARLEARYQELSRQFGRQHPQMQRLEAEIASLRKRIDAEGAAIGGGLARQHAVNLQRLDELGRSLGRQRAKVMDLKRQRDELALLTREVEMAQRAYDLVSQRLVQTRLDSQADTTNIVMLDDAAVPHTPSSPKSGAIIFATMLLAPLVAGGACVLAELIDRRTRSERQLAEALEARVLGTIPDRRGAGRLGGLLRATRDSTAAAAHA